MIIYFEDDSITNGCMYSETGEEFIKVDAGDGYTANYIRLLAIEKKRDFNTQVYTNSIVALSGRWCWDEENRIPQLFLRNQNNEWKNITRFTNRELRQEHDLAKLYINGEFKETFDINNIGTPDCSNMTDEEINRIADKLNSIPEEYLVPVED